MATRYKLKHQSLDFFTAPSIILIDAIPLIKAVINPTKAGQKLTTIPALATPPSSKTKLATIIGIESKKLNDATSSLLAPPINPAHIVLPLRLIPGKSAKPCAVPISKACLKLNGLTLVCFDIFSQAKRSTAVIKKHSGKKLPLKAFSAKGLNIKAKINVGTQAT